MERLYIGLDTVRHRIADVALAVSAVLTALTFAMLTIDIVARYIIGRSIQHVAELSILAFLYVFMLGVAALYARNEDIVLETFFEKLPPRGQAIWLLVVHLAIVATMIVICVQTDVIMDLQKTVRTPSLRLPIAVQYTALLIASAIIAFSSAVDAYGSLVRLATGHIPSSRRSTAYS